MGRLLPLRRGTTVTRRPNSLASNEYAPGPSNATATESNMEKTKIKLLEGGPTTRPATAAARVTTDKYGVKKPITRDADTNKATAKSSGVEVTRGRFAAFIRKVAATEILNSSNATPGPP